MPLSEDERRAMEEQYRREVREEHERRSALINHERPLSSDEELARQVELARVRHQVREDFWKEQGYVKYLDSRGAESWVTPQEFAERWERRKARQRPWQEFLLDGIGKRILVLAVVVTIAVVVGIVLGISH